MKARWNHGVWLETADKAFKFHLGRRMQFDVVGAGANDSVLFGTGGFTRMEDAVNFRRARLTADGTIWENYNFTFEFDFINTFDSGVVTNATGNRNNVEGVPVPTDLWIEATQIPIFGHFRVGNQKPPISFEHFTSSRFLNFLERSYGFDAFVEDGNNGFSPGLMLYNWTENQNATWALGYFKTTRSIFGWNVGDGEWGPVGRATWLPYYADEGRCLVHVGVGATYRDLDEDQVRFRSRTLLRNGPAVLHTVAAISQLEGDRQALVNPEFVVQNGPWILQAEYTGTQVQGIRNVLRTPVAFKGKAPNTYYAQGAYAELLYFLTGEHRDYNRKLPGFGRVVPINNAFFVQGHDGARQINWGAWQIGARYSWLDLNDAGVFGGQIHSLTLGLNWFLNPNAKIQWNYELAHRDIPNGTSSGNYQGAGVRFAFDF